MRTLNVSISESEYKLFGIKNDQLTFSQIVDLVIKRQFQEKLKESVKLAEKTGLSSLTMDEINEEIKAVRNAKNSH